MRSPWRVVALAILVALVAAGALLVALGPGLLRARVVSEVERRAARLGLSAHVQVEGVDLGVFDEHPYVCLSDLAVEGRSLDARLDVCVTVGSWLDLALGRLGGDAMVPVRVGPGTVTIRPSGRGVVTGPVGEAAAHGATDLPRLQLIIGDVDLITPLGRLSAVRGQLQPSLERPVALEGWLEGEPTSRGNLWHVRLRLERDLVRLAPAEGCAWTVPVPGLGPVDVQGTVSVAPRAARVQIEAPRLQVRGRTLRAARVEGVLGAEGLALSAVDVVADDGSERVPFSATRLDALVPVGADPFRLVVPRLDAAVDGEALVRFLRSGAGGPATPDGVRAEEAPGLLPASWPPVEVRDGRLELVGLGLSLAAVRASARPEGVDLSAELSSDERTEGTVALSWRPAGDVPATVRLDYQGCLPPAPWRATLAEGGLSISPGCHDTLAATAWMGADEVTFQAKVGVAAWTVQEAHLASESMADVAFDAEAAGRVARDLSSAEVRLTSFALGPLHLSGALSATRLGDTPVIDARLDVPEQACDNVVRALPAGLLPELDGVWLGGTFRLAVRYTVDLAKVFTMYDARLAGREEPYTSPLVIEGENHCEVTTAPRGIDVQSLNRADFVHRVVLDDEREVRVGPGTDSYVPLADLPPTVVQGALATEDLSFYSHPGVNPGLLKTALEMDLHAGRFKYGGSTITQQLVKNLYLTRAKTLARKLEDILLALYVETAVSKDRLLELYLNVIEFGDGVYGIRNASRVYFGKEPRELLPEEAAFLMTCKPAPPDCQRLLDRGAVTPHWRGKVDYVLERLYKRVKVIDGKEYEDARGREIRFLGTAAGVARPAGPVPADDDGDDDLLP
jgi:hypothetical protein